MIRAFQIIITFSLIIGCTNSTDKSQIKDLDHQTNKSIPDTNSNQKVINQDKNEELFDSLHFYFKNFRFGNNPAYAKDLSEYLLEDGIKMLPSNHTEENHFFKFEDMEGIWITTENTTNNYYRLIIKDKSGHKNIFTDCRINCNNLINIYYALNSYMTSKIPNCKTRFEIDNSYLKELAENKEWEMKLQKKSDMAKLHNDNHIPQNIFDSKCELCSKEKNDYYYSPEVFSNLQRYYKNWITVNNKNFTFTDNSRNLTELKIEGIPWSGISRVSYRLDGASGIFIDTKNTSNRKNIQKYFITFTLITGQSRDFPMYLLVENNNVQKFVQHINEYLKKFKKRQPISTEVLDLRF